MILLPFRVSMSGVRFVSRILERASGVLLNIFYTTANISLVTAVSCRDGVFKKNSLQNRSGESLNLIIIIE